MKKTIIVIVVLIAVLALGWYLMYGIDSNKDSAKNDSASQLSTADLEREAATVDFSSIEGDFGVEVNTVTQ